MLLQRQVKWKKKPEKVGKEDISWASSVAHVCHNPDEDTYSCCAIRRKDSYEGTRQVQQTGVMLEGMKAFGCGQIADHVCRSCVIRYNTHGGPFVSIITVTDNKNFLCLENAVWATNYIKKKRKAALKRSCLLCKKEIEQIFREVFFRERGEKFLSALQK